MLTGPGRVDAFAVGEKEIVLRALVAQVAGRAAGADAEGRRAARAAAHERRGDSTQLALGEPEQFTFAGANGETVYGYVMKPANFDARRRYPIAFIVHGGPQVVVRQSVELSLESADLRRRGLCRPCSSTSTARPATARRSPIRSAATGAASRSRTCRRVSPPRSTKYPWLDGERACALGASYGGYMMNWIAGNWPSRSGAWSVTPASSTAAPWRTRPRSCGSTNGSTAARRSKCRRTSRSTTP